MSTVFYCADIKNRSTNIGGGGEHSENKKAQTDREMTRLFGELSVTVVRLLGNEDAMEKSPDIVAAYFELLEMVIRG